MRPDLSILQYLLQEGADPNERNFKDNTCFDTLITGSINLWDHLSSHVGLHLIDFISDAMRVLLGKDDPENLDGFLTSGIYHLAHFEKDRGLLSRMFMPIFSELWSNIDFTTRLDVAYNMVSPCMTTQLFWHALSQRMLDSRCLILPADETGQPSECLVGHLAWTMSSEPIDIKGLRLLLHQAVSLDGIQLSFENHCGSPMLKYLQFSMEAGMYIGSFANLEHQRLTSRLRNWAHEVELAGQDLQTYGHWEEALLSDVDLVFDALLRRTPDGPFKARVLKFKYGPSPEDWEIWATTSMDEAAADFWGTLDADEPLLPIPGSWPETDLSIDDVWDMKSYNASSRRRRIRGLRYLGLGRSRESEVYGPEFKVFFLQTMVDDGKRKKEWKRRFYLENGITPPCREYIS
ncbi:hypothetical protein LTS17_005917 [Exophiala oligosperma]